MRISISTWRSMSAEERVDMIKNHVTKMLKGGERYEKR